MADNIIQRIIRLVLDKESAKKTQEDANQVAAGIDSAWKSVATKIGGYLAAGFLISKIKDLGKAAVHEAMESQAAWAQLKGTIDASGGSFDKMETRIHAAADAFQDATVHDDDAFAEMITRMTSLTGDAEASLNNAGLVANVAAQFFKGDLGPATDLVAKAMNGNTNALRKMGIQAKDAQDALDILAKRSMGAATREANTFGGQLKQMDEQWKDVLKDLGNAIISSDGTTDAIGVLRAGIKTLSEWIAENKNEIREWVTKAVLFAIDAADVFIRAVWGMGNALTGGFQTSLGIAAKGLQFLIKGLEGVARVSAVVDAALGNTNAMVSDLADADKLHKQADAINDWADAAIHAGSEKVKKGIDVLSKPLFSSEDFMNRHNKVGTLEVNRPMVGKNSDAKDAAKDAEDLAKALKDFREDAKASEQMAKTLGDQFDATGAEISRTTKLLSFLAGKGIDPASVGMGNLSDRLRVLVREFKPVQDAIKEYTDESKKAENMQRVLGGRFDATGAEIDRTTKLLNVLAEKGISPTSIGLGDLSARWTELVTKIKPAEEETRALAVSTIELNAQLGVMAGEQRGILMQIQALTDQGMSPNSKKAQELTSRYNSLTQAMNALRAATAVEELKRQQADVLTQIRKSLDEGLLPTSEAIQDLTERYDKLTTSISQAEKVQALAEAYKNLGDEMSNNAAIAAAEGLTSLDAMTADQQSLRKAIEDLIAKGIKPEDKALQDLIKRYKEVSNAIKEQTQLMELQSAVADVLAEALGAALQGGLHEAAVAKAKQNAIEAAEMLVRAGAFYLMGRPDKAAQALVLAEEFGVVAAMWGAFAALTGGGGGSEGGGGGGRGASASGGGMGESRAASDDSAAKANQPQTEVTINLIGPGFHALNPAVQEVVWGATQEAAERFGPNTRIRVSSQQ